MLWNIVAYSWIRVQTCEWPWIASNISIYSSECGGQRSQSKCVHCWKHCYVRLHLSDESSAKQWEMSGNEKLSLPLFTYWLALCCRPWWEQQTAFNVWSHSVEKELSLGIWYEGVALQSKNVRNLNTNKTNLVIGSIAWNPTLANLILTLSILRQLLCNLLLKLFSPLLFPFLCLCEVQLNTWQLPARSFTQAHYWWKRSEWLSEK